MNWWNWPNEWKVSWPEDEMSFTGNHLLWLLLPVFLLISLLIFTIFFGNKIFPKISKKMQGRIFTSMGFIAIFWELWFDIASIASPEGYAGHNTVQEQFRNGFDLCRLNMYLLGTFLFLRRIEWVKWIAATCLFGGMSTMVDHYSGDANVHSLITHGIILSLFPSIAISISRENYKFRNYIHAHILNLSIVAFLIITNYAWSEYPNQYHAGELTVIELDENVLVGWAPGVWAMVMWIFAVMFVELSYFLVHRSIYWAIYQKGQGITWTGAFKAEFPKDKAEWYGFRWNKERIDGVKTKVINWWTRVLNNLNKLMFWKKEKETK